MHPENRSEKIKILLLSKVTDLLNILPLNCQVLHYSRIVTKVDQQKEGIQTELEMDNDWQGSETAKG